MLLGRKDAGKRLSGCCQGSQFFEFVLRGFRVMATKSFVMVVLATLAGPAIGIGLFVLINNL